MRTVPPAQKPAAQKGHFLIPHALLDAALFSQMGGSVWSVYTGLLRHADQHGCCYPTVKRLCALTGLGRTTVSQAIQTLQKMELIQVTHGVVGKRKNPRNLYCISALSRSGTVSSGYVLISRELIDAGVIRHIRPSAWVVYVILLRHTDASGSCYPSEERIALKAGLCRNTVSSAIKRLRSHDLITVTSEHSAPGSFPHHRYRVLDQQAAASRLGQSCPKTEQQDVQFLGRKYNHPSCDARQGSEPMGAAGGSPVKCFSTLGSGQSRAARVYLQLCFHLGGEEELTRLLVSTSPLGLVRRRWLDLTSKTVDSIAQQAEGQSLGDVNLKRAVMVRLLDERLERSAPSPCSSGHSLHSSTPDHT